MAAGSVTEPTVRLVNEQAENQNPYVADAALSLRTPLAAQQAQAEV